MIDLLRRLPMLCLLVAGTAVPCAAQDRADIVVADFEGPDYGDWIAVGEALEPRRPRGHSPVRCR